MIKLELIFIRHGRTAANEARQFTGWSHTPLSLSGQAEAQEKRAALRSFLPAQGVLVSPLYRCIETARILFPEFRPIIFPEFVERGFGRFEGKNLAENSRDEEFARWLDDRQLWPGGMESDEHLVERLDTGLKRVTRLALAAAHTVDESLFNGFTTAEQRILPLETVAALEKDLRFLVVCHGGVIGSLCRTYGKGYEDILSFPDNLEPLAFYFDLDSQTEKLSFSSIRMAEDFSNWPVEEEL
ncbi:MAG: histidine phosphatase family protein [Eubacteriales bacterium]|nr:histidine phosphatase family protein [Eubacteriales bacterium]